MKKMLVAFSMCFVLVGAAQAKDSKSCKFADVTRLKDHMAKHVTYPAKGKDIKEACKKEAPEEFTKTDRTCFEGKIKDDAEYKSADDVLKTLGVQ